MTWSNVQTLFITGQVTFEDGITRSKLSCLQVRGRERKVALHSALRNAVALEAHWRVVVLLTARVEPVFERGARAVTWRGGRAPLGP